MASVGRQTLIPLVLAIIVFILLVPLTCVGSSDNAREFCQTVWLWKIPWSSVAGPGGTAAMYGIPVIAGIVTFFVARAVLARRNRSVAA